MSFAAAAYVLVNRQAGAGQGTESSFSTLAIVGISLGGAGFLVLFSVGMMHFRYLQHKRRTELDRITIANSLSNRNGTPSRVKGPRIALRHNLDMRNSSAAAWETLPSHEDLRIETSMPRRRTEKRKSDMLSWPLPRMGSAKNGRLKRIRNSKLQAIPESPNSRSQSPRPHIQPKSSTNEFPLPAELESITATLVPKPDGDASEMPQCVEHLLSASSQLVALEPALLFSGLQNNALSAGIVRPQTTRSFSGPSASTNTTTGEVHREIGPSNPTHRSRSRSLSSGTCNGAAPTAPLPPLPTTIKGQDSSRPASCGSASSFDSLGTSILNSPNSKASVDFSQRHPEMNLGVQIRAGESDLRSALMSGPRQERVRSKISDSPRLLSSVASLRVASARNSFELKRLSSKGANNAGNRPSQLPPRLLQTIQSPIVSRASRRPSEADKMTPPKRDSRVRRISDAFGSPIEHRRNSASRAMLESRSMPPREMSQTSQTTASSASPSNPFQWDSPQIPNKSSSIKASPGRKKAHKRQGSIRTSATAVQHLGSLKISTSSSQMGQIVEESREVAPRASLKSSESMSRPPSSHDFAPQLRYPSSYRASLTTESPRLSLVQYEPESDYDGRFGLEEQHSRDSSQARPGALPESNRSSVPIPKFPPPGRTASNDGAAFYSLSSESSSLSPNLVTSSPFSSSPRQYIPGLSLVEQPRRSGQDLKFPTIEIMSSPEREQFDYGIDAPVLSPLAPRPVQVEPLSSPPIPRSLSPPLKSNPTTQVSHPPSPIQTQRITPLSSTVDPMNTKPDFASSTNSISIPYQFHPTGPRDGPPQDVLKTAKMLRRMNTEVEMLGNRETRRYFRIGRQSSPEGSRDDILSAIPTHVRIDFEEEKENDRQRREGGTWDDGDDFWNTSVGEDKGSRGLLGTPVSRTSATNRVAWGGVDVKEKTPSIASDGAVSFCEEDFF